MKYNKIHIYNRQFSRNRNNPDRPNWFDYEKVFTNLLSTIDFNLCDLTVLFHEKEDYNDYFIKKYERFGFKVKFIDVSEKKWKNKTLENAGWSWSTAAAAESIKEDNLSEQDLLYIVDDDYLHMPNWAEIGKDYLDNFLDDNSCVCFNDHFDKYLFTDKNKTIDQFGTNLGMYSDTLSKIRISNYCHWRTVPNCMALAMLQSVKIFNRDFDLWIGGHSDSSICFNSSKRHNTEYWTPIRSLSTHCVYPFLAPFINWEFVINKFNLKNT